MELVARLPWWAGVALAALSYLLLHQYAQLPEPATAPSRKVAEFALNAAGSNLAGIGQYLLPALCLVGSLVSALKQRKRSSLAALVANNDSAKSLDGMSWREFEMLVGEGFRLQGYKVVENGPGGPDGGIDLVLSKPGMNGSEKYLVQCKQWRAHRVGVDVVRELYGVMAAKGAAGGFVVTSGRFTDEAQSFAKGRNVSLIDGGRLHRLIQQAKATADNLRNRPAQPREVSPQTCGLPKLAPCCPLCEKPMALRTAKRGTHSGEEFWGCSDFPSCRGTRRIA